MLSVRTRGAYLVSFRTYQQHITDLHFFPGKSRRKGFAKKGKAVRAICDTFFPRKKVPKVPTSRDEIVTR